MKIDQTEMEGACVVNLDPFVDQRGVFARFYCSKELETVIGSRRIVNVNFSRTNRMGTVRGMHFQRPPHQEMKLVRCIKGAVYDVIVDIRQESPTFLNWHGEVLTAENMKMLVVPEGFAHGFQTLEDDCELLYLTTAFYEPKEEGGIRYNDPTIGIKWPLEVSDISSKDACHSNLVANAEPLGAR
jgi:dTDP-4-dehydrorhamnose 3,5-epimerase